MARKVTYIYRVEIGEPNPNVQFCYARNAGCAIDGFRQMYPKESAFSCYPVGQTKQVKENSFELIVDQEYEYLLKTRGKIGEKYSVGGVVPMMDEGTFVPASKGVPA